MSSFSMGLDNIRCLEEDLLKMEDLIRVLTRLRQIQDDSKQSITDFKA